MIFQRTLVTAALVLACAGSAVAEPVSALTFSGFSANATNTTSTRGYAFNVTQTGLFASYLGVYDYRGDGLGQSHDMGLWNAAGVLIASATIGVGTTGLLRDGFRYVDIADVALDIGTYVVGALYVWGAGDDHQAISLTGVATANGITYGGARFINNGIASLTQPTSPMGITGMVGGTLMVDTAAVPEPASGALVLTALAGLALARRRRRH